MPAKSKNYSMDREAVINQLRNNIEDYLSSRNLILVDLIYRHEGMDLFLRILTDWPEGGISIDECARINRELSDILDENDALQLRYILEVSSPGLDRPLKQKNDFLRCVNKKVRIFLKESVDGIWELAGIISKVEDEYIYIDIAKETKQIPLNKINRGKQIIK